jgi:hypothetical protein
MEKKARQTSFSIKMYAEKDEEKQVMHVIHNA